MAKKSSEPANEEQNNTRQVNETSGEEVKNQDETITTEKDKETRDQKKEKKQDKKSRNNKEKAEKKKDKAATEEKEIAEKEESGKKLQEMQDRYIRLSAEFDNYRKRTMKEKAEMLKSAGESTLVKILPVLDDFERALSSMNDAKDIEAVKSGVELIYNKFKDTLTQQGLKEIPAMGESFNTDMHEAITKIPAPEEKLKGKIVDVVEKGYYLNEKVIRFTKVVIGE